MLVLFISQLTLERITALDTSSIRTATIVVQLYHFRVLSTDNDLNVSSLGSSRLRYPHRKTESTNPAPLPDVACPLVVVCVFQPPTGTHPPSRNVPVTYIPQYYPDGLPMDTSIPSECRDPTEEYQY